MTVYIIDPLLTLGVHEDATIFATYCIRELEQHVTTSRLASRYTLAAAKVSRDDIVILFNGPPTTEPAVHEFLDRGDRAGIQFIPVAIDQSVRRPLGAAARVQSFDLIDELRLRDLEHSQIPTVASAFARIVIARVQPTLCKEQMRLFISHRRLDGEELAFAFWEQAKRRVTSNRVFRDLSDLRVGVDNDEKILESLGQSDAVVFLDTPKAGESQWIARELEIALARNLPIIWTRFGPVENRGRLPVVPSGTPHFDFPELDVSQANISSELVDQIIHTAFNVSRTSALRVFDSIERVISLKESGRAEVTLLDEINMLYEIRVPREIVRYSQRPLVHIVQFFGRWPDTEDQKNFVLVASRAGYESHSKHGVPYDSGILVGPIPPQECNPSGQVIASFSCHVDSMDTYVSNLEVQMNRQQRLQKKRGVIISGAFPESEPQQQQYIKDALYAFVRSIYERGGMIIFGGHPTFQPMIFQIARDMGVPDQVQSTHLYLSRYFVSSQDVEGCRTEAVTTATDVIENDRGKSLTALREAMVRDDEAIALIAIGGREASPERSSGVDEEIMLARAAGLPVFLIGSAGGRTANIASDWRAKSWQPPLNQLSASENETLCMSYDYGVLANMVLAAIGL